MKAALRNLAGPALTFTLTFTLALSSTLLPGLAGAQTAWPEKSVRVVVPWAPGGITDIVAWLLAQKLTASLGQQFLVDNKGGAGGNIGADIVAKAPADGYTLMVLGDNNTIAPALYAKLNHDVVKDFAPLALLVTGSHILVAHPSLPVNNVRELVDYAKKHPKELSYASPGNGTAQHLGAELFKAMAGNLDITHIPYKGGGQAIGDIVGGQVKLGMLGLAPAIPHLKAGKLKALGVTGRKRVAILPDVPTIAESGLPGFETLDRKSTRLNSSH